MKRIILIITALTFFSCKKNNDKITVVSPDTKVSVVFEVQKNAPYYSVVYNGQPLIAPSMMGFSFTDMPDLTENFEIIAVQTATFDETWTPVWGIVNNVRNNYNELLVCLQEKSELKRKLNIRFRVYNDGIGFRYEFPKQEQLSELHIREENTSFNHSGNHKAWWIQVHYDSYELLYNTTSINEIPSIIANKKTRSEGEFYMKNPADTLIAVSTPVTMQVNDSLFISIHEAALYDYSEMVLTVDSANPLQWKSFLVPGVAKHKVKVSAPFHTPWRTIQIGKNAGELITSHLIENLNEPCAIEDVSWIKPIKYIGIWWGYHVGKWSWNPSPTMGATTENAFQYIDFAANNGIDAVLVEAWCVGEEWGQKKNFITPNAKFDLMKIRDYAKGKNIQLILHHETMGNVNEYEAQKDTAYKLLESLGLNYIKTGYAYYINSVAGFDPWKTGQGQEIMPAREFHHGQQMVNHYTKIVQLAASHKVSICAHEPIKPTGEHRTWPNMMTREGARGQEYNAWIKALGNPIEHNTILPFTRMLGGPMDFTPGIFDITFDKYRDKQRVNTTLSQQLALFVIFYSPMQMAADLIENYKDHQAFKFIRDVKVNWDTTIVLNAYPGDYLTIARKSGDEWFVGSITDENPREMSIALNFLDSDKIYEVEIYSDAPDTDFDISPEKYEYRKDSLKASDSIHLKLCKGGGQAIRFSVKK